MIYKLLGRTKEKVPAIGMGSWKLGMDPAKEMQAIKNGIANGMNLIDTAEMYHSENIVGEAVKGEEVFIATKVSPNHFHYDDVINSCNQSLRNLGVKAIDLYQLHWPNPNIPITETMRAMERLMKDGKIRHIGVSNFSVGELKAAQDAMKSYEIVSNQLEYSVFARRIEEDILPYCMHSGITVIAYSPLAMGKVMQKGTKAYDILDSIAKKHKKTVPQVALNWVVSRPHVIAIPKAGNPQHPAENAGSCEFDLDKEDLRLIDTIESNYMPISSTLNAFTKRTSTLWSGLMDKRESFRSKFKI